jgi:hypothetical protein
VPAGSAQSGYECAEFVSRSLASAGYLTVGATDPQGSYSNYNYGGSTYDLLWTSSKSALGGPLGVEDLLIALGWSTGGSVQDCSAILVVGSEGYETHIVVGVDTNVIDAHNMARYHVNSNFYDINNVYNPPSDAIRYPRVNLNSTIAAERSTRSKANGKVAKMHHKLKL